jgi:beta-glucosidase
MQGVRWVTTINEPNILATLGPASRILTVQDPAAVYRSMSATKSGSGGGVVGAATLSEPADDIVAALTKAHIAAVDRATFERTPKPSARHLGSLARA